MNRSFVLYDKNNNLEKTANVVVKFTFEEKDYLIYSIDENEQNCQIFTSRLVLNSEGKNFIDELSADEKGKLSNIIYNIVILVPSDEKRGVSFESLLDGLQNKFKIKLSSAIPSLEQQEYYSNCSIAITSKILVEAAIKLYSENLNDDNGSNVLEVPTWTAPTVVTAPVETPSQINNNMQPSQVSIGVETIPEISPIPNLNIQPNVINEINKPIPDGNSHIDMTVSNVTSNVANANTSNVSNSNITSSNDGIVNNPQTEKIAIVSDPSLTNLGIKTQQPNVGKLKNSGFARNKYVIIGTICLVLAIIVVVVVYFLIKNME